MTLAYISHPSFVLHNMGEYHPECPLRVTAITDRLIGSGLLALMENHDAPAATVEQIARAHPHGLYERLKAASPVSGLRQLDPDTAMCPDTFEAALHAAGAAVLATDLVCSAKVQRVFCNVRPPGHHAEADRPMGFCFFNSIAVGIQHALVKHGIERVALVDFDVHHGNGSEDIFAYESRVLMVSTFQSPLYPYSGTEPLGPNMVNVPLPPHSDGTRMRQAVTDYWLPRLEAFRPQLLFVSAGFDAHRADELSQLRWVEADYKWVTQQLRDVSERHAQGRIVSMLEGGYDLQALALSVEAHVRVLMDLDR